MMKTIWILLSVFCSALLFCKYECRIIGRSLNSGSISITGIRSVISSSMFEQILKHRDDALCSAKGFYTYDAFIAAANSFNGFRTTSDIDTQKREIAAFLAQTSHETTVDGQLHLMVHMHGSAVLWKSKGALSNTVSQMISGLVFQVKNISVLAPSKSHTTITTDQLERIGANLLENPGLVAAGPAVSFKTSLWLWMTTQAPKPSCHDVATGKWKQLLS